MGVIGLWDLLSPVGHRVSNDHVRNKVLAVDASIWLTQFVKAMRDADGAQLRNAHLLGVLRRCIKLLFLSVKPVLIFDGETPPIKRQTLKRRYITRERHAAKLRRLAEKLLLNRLKQSALAHVVPVHTARSAARITSSKQQPQLSILDDLDKTIEIDNGEESDKNEEQIMLPNDLEVLDDDTLVGLPSNMQSKVLKQMKVQHRAQHREVMMKRQDDPTAFSQTQIEAFLRHTALNRRINRVRNAINITTGAQNRIASDSTRQYVFKERNDSSLPTSALNNYDSDDDNDDDGDDDDDILANKSVSKPVDILARIRAENDAINPLFKPINDVHSCVHRRKNENQTGVGWASKVLEGKGGLSLGGNELVNTIKGADDNISNQSLSESEGDESNQWEDGDADINTDTMNMGKTKVVKNSNNGLSDKSRNEFTDDINAGGNSTKKERKKREGSNEEEESEDEDEDDIEWVDGKEEEKFEPHRFSHWVLKAARERPNGLGLMSKKDFDDWGLALDRKSGKGLKFSELKAGRTNEKKMRRFRPMTNYSNKEEYDESRKVQREWDLENSKSGDCIDDHEETRKDANKDVDNGGSGLTEKANRFTVRPPSLEDGNAVSLDENLGKGTGRPDSSGTNLSNVEMACNFNVMNSKRIMLLEEADGGKTDDEKERVTFNTGKHDENGKESELNDVHLDSSALDHVSSGLEKTGKSKHYIKEQQSECFSPGEVVKSSLNHCSERKETVLSKCKGVTKSTTKFQNGKEIEESEKDSYGDKGDHEINPVPNANASNQRNAKQKLTDTLPNVANDEEIDEITPVPKANETVDDELDEITPVYKNKSEYKKSKRHSEGIGYVNPEEESELQLAITRSLQEIRGDGVKNLPSQQHTEHNNITSTLMKEKTSTGVSFSENEDKITAEASNELGNGKESAETSWPMDDEEAMLIAESEELLNNSGAPTNLKLPPKEGPLTPSAVEKLKRELQTEEKEIRRLKNSHQSGVETVSDEMYGETRDLLKLLGIPYLQAPMEAEAQCAFLNMHKIVDGVISEDSDSFLFGALTVYRQLFQSGKFAEAYESVDILNKLGLSRQRLIHLAYLLGSDYTTGVRGVGVVNSMEILEAFVNNDNDDDNFKGLNEFKEWMEKISLLDKEPDDMINIKEKFCWKHRNMKRNWEIRDKLFPNERVAEAYWKPNLDKNLNKFKWGYVDFEGLRQFCWEKFAWPDDKFNSYVGPLKKELQSRKGIQQRRIEEFFKPHRFAKIRSQRLQNAVMSIAEDEAGAEELMAPTLPKVTKKKRNVMTYARHDTDEDEEENEGEDEREEACMKHDGDDEERENELMIKALEDVERSRESVRSEDANVKNDKPSRKRLRRR